MPKTHYFFSVSKDKTLKYWDADKFEHITTLQVMKMCCCCLLLLFVVVVCCDCCLLLLFANLC